MKKRLFGLLIIFILSTVAGAFAISMRFPVYYLDIIQENAGNLDPSWILAVIKAESSFRPGVQSHAGAQGLMQLMPSTALEMSERMGMTDFEPEDVWKPEVNIALGSFYLNRLLTLFDYDMTLTLAAYNAGMGRVRQWLRNPEYSSDGENLDVIPISETYNYLRRVKFNQRVYSLILTLTGRRTAAGRG